VSPEYWQRWFDDPLDRSDGAERANRGCCDAALGQAAVATAVEMEEFGLGRAGGVLGEEDHAVSSECRDGDADEMAALVSANSVAHRSDGPVDVEDATVARVTKTKAMDAVEVRAVTRQAMSLQLKETEAARPEVTEPPSSDEATIEVPHQRDKGLESSCGRCG
jgi:hypothetical protein